MKLSEILEQCKTNFHFENFFDFNVIDVSANSRIIKNNFIESISEFAIITKI